MSKVSEHHNEAAGRIVAEIIKGTIAAGGDEKSVMVLLESIVAGCVTVIVREEHDGDTIKLLHAGAVLRCADLRKTRRKREALSAAEPKGSA